MITTVWSMIRRYGFFPVLLGFWHMCCFVVKNALQGNNLVNAYKNHRTAHMLEMRKHLETSEQGRELLRLLDLQAEHYQKYKTHINHSF